MLGIFYNDPLLKTRKMVANKKIKATVNKRLRFITMAGCHCALFRSLNCKTIEDKVYP